MGTTARARRRDLRVAVDELGPTARHAAGAFARLNAALPRHAPRSPATSPASLPELPATITAAKPWLAQAKQLLSDEELGGLLDGLQPAHRRTSRSSATRTHALAAHDRPRSTAASPSVIIPTGKLKVDDGALSANVENYKEFWYAMVGQDGEGQCFDGNGGYLRLSGRRQRPTRSAPASPTTPDVPFVGTPTLPPLSTRPAYGNKLPPFDRSVPCYQQPGAGRQRRRLDRPGRRLQARTRPRRPPRPSTRRGGG